MTVKRESGVRAYVDRGLLQRVSQWRVARQLGLCGDGVYLERGVSVMRHPENVYLGDQVFVKSGARLCPTNPDAQIHIGDWTTVGYNTFIFATSRIAIGHNCLIAPHCYLVDANHSIARDTLIRNQSMSAAPIVLEDDVWLGAGVCVLKGVTIGRGAVVGAGVVVSRDVPPFTILVQGQPESLGERR